MTDSPPPPAHDAQDTWQQIRARLRAELGEATFASWLAPLTLVEVDGDQVTLGVGTRFLRDWIASHYAHRIGVLWAEERPGIQSADIVIHAGQPSADEVAPHAASALAPVVPRDGARCVLAATEPVVAQHRLPPLRTVFDRIYGFMVRANSPTA